MRELLPKDVHWILRRLPKQVTSVLRAYPGRIFLAGGAIRACVANEDVADFDLFAPNAELAELVALKLEGMRIWKSKNATTVWLKEPSTPPIQIIHRWTYDKPEELIESFDFTVAKAVLWFQAPALSTDIQPALDAGWRSLIHDDFYPDLAAKRLTYTKPQRNEDAGGSLLRVLKFYQKGYRIPLDSMAAVVARLCMGVELAELVVLKTDGGLSHEEALGQVLTGLLHEVDPLQDPEHIFHLPSSKESENECQ